MAPQKIAVEGKGPIVTWCGVCWGTGTVDGAAAFKVRNYFPFVFAASFSIFALVLLGIHPAADKLTASLTTILGTIVGFYFGGKRSDA